jgi:hypothetical protein
MKHVNKEAVYMWNEDVERSELIVVSKAMLLACHGLFYTIYIYIYIIYVQLYSPQGQHHTQNIDRGLNKINK